MTRNANVPACVEKYILLYRDFLLYMGKNSHLFDVEQVLSYVFAANSSLLDASRCLKFGCCF